MGSYADEHAKKAERAGDAIKGVLSLLFIAAFAAVSMLVCRLTS